MRWFIAALIAFAFTLGTARAADDDDVDATLASVRTEITSLRNSLHDKTPDAELVRLRQRAIELQGSANDIATRLSPELGGLQARLAQLGAPTPGTKEDPDVTSQRTQLNKSSAALEGQAKLARLLSVEAEQLAKQISVQRRALFQAQLGERRASILSREFWSNLRADFPRDKERFAGLYADLAESAGVAPGWSWFAALLAVVAVLAASAAIRRHAMAWISVRVPSGRLRRSLHAVIVVALWAGSAGVIAFALTSVADWGGHFPPEDAAALDAVSDMLWLAGYLAGLLHVLICASRPSWRLLPLPDPVADHLRAFPWLLAIVSFAVWLAEQLTVTLNTSLSMTVAVNCIVALALGLTMSIALVRAERLWRQVLRDDGAKRRPFLLTAIALVSWLVLAGAVVCLLTGYVAFGSFAVKQVLWSGILLGSGYVLAALIDDACSAFLAPPAPGSAGHPAADPASATAVLSLPTLSPAARSQAAVLVSGLLRIMLGLLVLMLLLAPFGEGPSDLLRRSLQWQQSWTVGEVKLRPASLLQGLVVLVLGLGAVRLLRNWLANRYLPTTSLDPGMRSSATTLFGYAGAVIAVSIALSAIGIGLERVAWVASALSVGIGFGLQAVVQNFVSGLILLAERPVKVGDWVSLGGVEGDIRRINVRATEIQMGDRSTVIVPNSEFITKIVRNVTMAEPLGLVQIKLPIPLAADAERVRALMLEAYQRNGDVLETPAPNVLLDGIDGANLLFNATGFVGSPRAVAGVRSTLLFDVLKSLREANVTLAPPPTVMLRPPPQPEPPPISAAGPSSAAPSTPGGT